VRSDYNGYVRLCAGNILWWEDQVFFRLECAITLFLLIWFPVLPGTAGADALSPITLPIEVMGAARTTRTVTVNVPTGKGAQSASLYLQIHNLSYPDKASVQVNNSGWMDLNNDSVQVAEPGKSYGGIGGGFASLKMTLSLPAGTVTDGTNTIRFRFNYTDGISSGFRVLAFNLVTSSGAPLLPASTFVQEDPNNWQPPLKDAADIATGKHLWYTAALKRSPLLGDITLQAHCTDCHARDGRDLKYFNYSNNSIIQRAIFHGLSQQQGQQIASYIRSLSVPNPGRPWNPPYQPGPGIDSQPAANWAAGAGLSAVLDRDSDMIPYLFPKGIQAAAIATNKTLDMRELPLSIQLPDWNHWLPKVYPLDAWGSAFLHSPLYEKYAGPENDPQNATLRARLLDPDWNTWPRLGSILDEIQAWGGDLHNFLINYNQPAAPWSPSYSEQVYSTGRWVLVKTWEMMQEFRLEGYGPLYYRHYGEARTWENSHAFHASPFMLGVPATDNGIDGSSLKTDYLSLAWYQVQMILNAGNRHQQGADTIDWQYTYGQFNDLYLKSRISLGMQMFAFIVKGMQDTDNGIGPDRPSSGWNPYEIGDVSLLVNQDWSGQWSQVSAQERSAMLQAALQNWFAKCQQYTPTQYYKGGLADPNAIPTGNYMGSWADRLWYMIPRYRDLGVDGILLNNICDWAATLWPKADWRRLKVILPNTTS